MSDEIVIEKGVPIPKNTSHGWNVKWKELGEKMEEGDSIVLPSAQAAVFQANVKITREGFRIITKREGVGKRRCWLVRRET